MSIRLSSQSNLEYKIVLEDEIYVEKYDSSFTINSKFTANNSCYVSGKKLVYDYYYIDLNGDKFKYEPTELFPGMDYNAKQEAWRFVSWDSIQDNTVDMVTMVVDTDENHILYSFPGYNQSVITYHHMASDSSTLLSESTGLIENEKNIWIHPPRDKMFSILELNPFPFIQAPYEIGNKWQWTLNKIGSFWGDPRWITWEGSLDNVCNYEITDKQKLLTSVGVLECFVIKAIGNNLLGNTQLIAYFNMDMGFVKLDYTNIDSTKLVLELVHISKL